MIAPAELPPTAYHIVLFALLAVLLVCEDELKLDGILDKRVGAVLGTQTGAMELLSLLG